ncbi:DUF6161 domain-containing protein [Psychrobacter pygoscelis]|uniref:DUF6161 domain-containing protein n=1 Tax=Psychrobacter pygoscelis TaxID=2488563 RepID=UPI00103BFB53|nr:DUF6161 domain-containing protein [Psychrobacter pygoscelis]
MEDNKNYFKFEDRLGLNFSFPNFKELKVFIDDEFDFWVKYENELTGLGDLGCLNNNSPLILMQYSLHLLKELKSQLERLASDDSTSIEYMHSKLSDLRSNWLSSSRPFVIRGLKILEKYDVRTANAFFKVFIDSVNIDNHRESLFGSILAYEFEMQGEEKLTSRRDAEEASIDQLRSEILSIKNNLFEEATESQKVFKDWVSDAAKKYNDTSQRQVDKFEKEYEKWSEKVVKLESTYEEKLRLAKPAEYWEKKAKNFKESGDLWARRLTGLVISGLVGLVVLLAIWIYVQKDAIALGVESLQGVVLFITLLSIYAFAIKAVSKMTFSSYHLQRDAEEREQLTHLYLSLINEGADLDTDSRSIVLQSLFSRVDSGLISGDSSPTMPGLPEIVQIATRRD